MAQNSNYNTNFNGQTVFDILSSVSEPILTAASTYNNYYGYYFYLGDLLIQFTDLQGQNLTTKSGGITINYPQNFPTTPYIVLTSVCKIGNGSNVNAPITLINNIGFVCTLGPSGNSGVPMFLAIGPRNGSYSNSYNVSNYNPAFSSINNNLISSTSNISNDLGAIQITNTSGGYVSAYYARFITVGDLRILFTDFGNTLNVGHTYNGTYRVYFPTLFFTSIYTVIVSTYGSSGNINYNIQSINTDYFQISITGSCQVIQYLAIGK